MTSPQLISPRYLLPIEPEQTVLSAHSVLIENEKIIAILPTPIAKQQYANVEEIILDKHVLMPGLINLHSHTAMSLLRGYADDLDLMDWLSNHIWPAEKKFMDNLFVHDGTLLGMAEMLRGGTTTVNDMYFYHSAVAKAGLTAGMRTFVGCTVIEFPTNFADTAKAHIAKAMAQRAEFEGEPLITFTLAPHAPYSVSDESFKEIVKLADQYDMRINCHIHETQSEIVESEVNFQMRPLARLHRLGVLSSRLIAAHMVVANNEELTLMHKTGVHISHNPASNMKLASGIARIQDMQDVGINVGLGTDGPASNNKLDLFADMRLTALLAKVSGDPKALAAFNILKMATLNGAKALGIDHKVGSLMPGKEADMIAIDLSAPETQPCYNIPSQLVYAAGRENVTDVWVRGRQLMQNRQLLTLPEQKIQAIAQRWQDILTR